MSDKCRPDYSTSALIQEFNNFRQRTCAIAAAGGEYLAIFRSSHLNFKKSFYEGNEAEEYLWRNAAITFFSQILIASVVIEIKTQKIIAASDAACNFLNENLIGMKFSQLSSDRDESDRLWNEINQNGYLHGDINFIKHDGQKTHAKIAGETTKSPSGNSYGFLKLSPEL